MSVARSVRLVVLVATLDLVGEAGMMLVVSDFPQRCAPVYPGMPWAEVPATAELDFAMWSVVGELAIVRGETDSVLGERAAVGVDSSFLLTCN